MHVRDRTFRVTVASGLFVRNDAGRMSCAAFRLIGSTCLGCETGNYAEMWAVVEKYYRRFSYLILSGL